MPRLEALSCGTPARDRRNEDSYFLADNGDVIVAAAIDGVTDRVVSQAQARHLASYGLNGSAFAAMLTRQAIARASWWDAAVTLRRMLLQANTELADWLRQVYGFFVPDMVFEQEPPLTPYRDDPRYLRLVLPACVVTLARLDLRGATLEFAHLGDTELLLFHDDGTVTRAAVQPRPNAARAVGLPDHPDPVVNKYRRVGLAHNFVDRDGQTDPTAGIGVINGLPEAADYLLAGSVDLENVAAVLLCSDGFLWPAPAEADDATAAARLDHMRDLIDAQGLRGYLDALRGEEADDPDRSRYPRPKRHDDATAVLIRLDRC